MNSFKNKKKIINVLGKKLKRWFKNLPQANSILFLKNKKKQTQDNIDKKLVYSLASSKIPNSNQIKHLDKTLTSKEKLIIKICLFLFLTSCVYLGVKFYNNNVVSTPKSGGVYSEALVGYPKNINPLYAINRDVDSDLAYLIYSRLFRYDENGQLIKDLVTEIETSDNKDFIITIRDDVKWHSGENLSSDDILFTFSLIQNSEYNSPLRRNFSGVILKKIDNNKIQFSLPSAYAPFPNLLTFGILPQSIWENISPESSFLTELNLQAIGSGPYKFKSLLKSKSGELKEYRLEKNDNYYGQSPYIEDLVFKFFPDINQAISSLNAANVQGLSYLPFDQKQQLLAQNSLNFYNLNLTQINSLFFNQTKNNNLSNKSVRLAIAYAIDKENITQDIFKNNFKTADSVIYSSSKFYNNQLERYDFNKELAEKTLDDDSWKKIDISLEDIQKDSLSPELKEIISYASTTGEKVEGIWRFKKDSEDNVSLLTLKLTVSDSYDFYAVANKLKYFLDNIGIRTTLEVLDSNKILETIKNKNFESILYGEVLGGDPDLFAFWHSSQIGDNGLNISSYKNDKVDELLEEARASTDKSLRAANYQEVQKIVNSELPIIPLYEDNYIYIQNKKIKGFQSVTITSPRDRFSGLANWYLKTSKKFSF